MLGTWEVVGFSLLPALGILVGSLLAETIRTPSWAVGAALHATAGIAIALVSIDVMPRLVAASPMWLIVCSFFAGACISLIIAGIFGSFRVRPGRGSVSALMVYVAVATDLTSDGLMVGAGTAIGKELGFLLAATQSIGNIPGGFATTSNFRNDGMPRLLRMSLLASIMVPAPVCAVLGFLVLRDTGGVLQSVALSVFMGILLLATIEDIVPEGDEPEPPRWISTAAFAGGFGLFALLSNTLK